MKVMQRYTATEVYTPDDHFAERRRRTLVFETAATSAFEVALAARIAFTVASHSLWIHGSSEIHQPDDYHWVTRVITDIRVEFDADEVTDQLEDQEPDDFSFTLFTNNGEQYYEVQLVPDTCKPR